MQGLNELHTILSSNSRNTLPPSNTPLVMAIEHISPYHTGPEATLTERPILLKPPGLPEPSTPGPSGTKATPSVIEEIIPKDFLWGVISLPSAEKEEPWHGILDWVTNEQQRKWSHKLGSYLHELIAKNISPGDFLYVLEDLKLEIMALDTVIQASFKKYFRENVGNRRNLSDVNHKVRQGNLLYLGHRFKTSYKILDMIIERLKGRSTPPKSINRRDIHELKEAIESLHKFFNFCKPA